MEDKENEKRESLPLKIFYSYSKEDEEFRIQLEKHLSLLKRQGAISGWHFRMITGGMEWKNQIDYHLGKSKIILLLVSSDFISSEYCYDVEMTKAMQLHRNKTAQVIPVILRPVDWQSAPFGKLQALPKDGKPITKWANRDEAFLDIVQGIRQIIQEFQPTHYSSVRSTNRLSSESQHQVVSNLYCSRCGTKAGGEKTTCTNYAGDHSFKSYTGDVYCSRCGIKAGEKTTCTNYAGDHSFKSVE